MTQKTVSEQEVIIGELLDLAVTPEQVMFLKDITPGASIDRIREVQDSHLRLKESNVAYQNAIRVIADVLKNSY